MTTADRREGRVDGGGTLASILLATDGSSQAALTARKAVAVSKGTGADLHVVHVWQPIPSPHYRSFIRRDLERQGREVLETVVHGEGKDFLVREKTKITERSTR